MASKNLDFSPNWVSPPGDTIRDILREQDRSEEWLARRLDSSASQLQMLLHGRIPITQTVADDLARSLGASSNFWLERDRQYRNDCKRLGYLPSVDTNDDDWLDSLPTDDMVKLRWISPSKSRQAKLAKCLEFFGVTSVQEWMHKYQPALSTIAYRKSTAFTTRDAAIIAWLRKGELDASPACSEWDPTRLQATIPALRKLSRNDSPTDFVPALRSLCSDCGISLSITPTPRGCPASGATFFRISGDAFLLLSLRHKTDDHFWFSFFHELGHLLLHRHLGLMVEDPNLISTEEEVEADNFAESALIPEEYQSELRNVLLNRWAMVRLARKIGVSPGIIVGQLQYKGRIPHHHFNYLKRRYEWRNIAC